MYKNVKYVIDFDSTIIKTEGLEELAQIALVNNPDRDRIMAELAHITDLGMNGEMGFAQSLYERIQLFQPTCAHLDELVMLLVGQVSDSILVNENFFRENAEDIYIVSGGFVEWIAPVVERLGIARDHVIANEFVYDEHGEIRGYDTQNTLAQDGGKVKAVRELGLGKNVVVIGDGYTDYEIYKEGLAREFIAYTENKYRLKVVELGTEARSFGEVLQILNADNEAHVEIVEESTHRL